MIFHIAKKEIKELRRSSIFLWVTITLVLLSSISIFISYSHFNSKEEQHEIAYKGERERWIGQGSTNPHNAAHYGTYAFKPAFPLSLIDQGVEKYTGVYIFLEAHTRNEAEQVGASDQTGLSRFGDITPDFILLFIIPLIIIVLSHQAITREKQNNILQLIKTQGVNNFQFILGKWFGNYIPIFIITTLLFLLSTIFVIIVDSTFDWKFILMMYLVYLSYYAILTSICISVSAFSKNSGISLVTLLSIWILSTLAIPKIASSFTNSEYPYPSRQEFLVAVAADKKKGIDGHDPWNEASKKLEAETLKAYQVDSLHQLPFNFDAYRMQKSEEHEAAVYFKHYEELKKIYQKQTGVYQKLAFLSPFLPVRFFSMSLAHTDYNTHWNFTDAAEKYRLEMIGALNNNFAENSKLGDWGYKADASLLSEIPQFNYHPPTFTETIAANYSNMLIIGLWFLATIGFMFLASKKL